MKLLVVLCIIGLVAAAPPLSARVSYPTDTVQVLRYENNNIGLGNYKFGFEQSDGTAHQQQGEIRNEGTENEFFIVRGSYSWIAPNGVKYIVTYLADDNGFQPEIEEGPGAGVPPSVVASLLGG